MDSSFNPPHFAHFAMAASSLPPVVTFGDSSHSSEKECEQPPYNARLLVFSVRNIEKTPKPGDAFAVQRLEMTIRLADHLASTAPLPGGVAVGILNEPTFVGKSRIVQRFMSRHLEALGHSPTSKAKLTFLIGTDTLTRFFVPRFYPNGMESALRQYFEEDGSLLVCGRRGTGQAARAVEEAELQREEVRPWVEKGCVRMLGSGEEGWEEVSSTDIRKAVKAGDRDRLEQLVPREIVAYIKDEGLYQG